MKQIERDGSVYRFNCVSRIQRVWLRRLWLGILFVPLLLINWFLAAVSIAIALPIFVIRGAGKNTKVLIDSTVLRWNVRKED